MLLPTACLASLTASTVAAPSTTRPPSPLRSNSGFNGTFCPVEEPEELQHLCPGDKGSPVTMQLNGTLTQVRHSPA